MPIATSPDGTTIHYEVGGVGDPVILVHGITESGRSWDPVTARLADRYRVIVPDLRGHGASDKGPSYDLGSMAGDVASVAMAEGISNPRLVGHSLGGAVVSALAGGFPARSVVNVDQPLKLDEFQAQLAEVAPALADPESFPMVIAGLFGQLYGDALPDEERARLETNRNPDQEVVLGIWTPILESPAQEVSAMVEEALAPIACPYLAIHGIDPGPGYASWLTGLVSSATVEVWDGLGHYPHLVDPDRFVARLEEFWATD
ncbi:MAG: alpha/beta fold hydrolase [Acidimicrobiia bacterium]